MKSVAVDKLRKGLADEERSVEERFNRAGAVFGENKTVVEESKPPIKIAPRPVDKVERYNFAMPPSDHAIIQSIQDRCMAYKVYPNASEVVRVGLHSLNKLSDSDILDIISHMKRRKRGRQAEGV